MTTTLWLEPMTGAGPDFHAAPMEEGLPTDGAILATRQAACLRPASAALLHRELSA
ncbi:hypothetical protein [Rhizobium sp. LjRoot254]|uniref:hypothetical protein n=1 Tax=Rhizobium sp. LjRoot254 TaxID=3342297 RepID=UPI003ECD5365